MTRGLSTLKEKPGLENPSEVTIVTGRLGANFRTKRADTNGGGLESRQEKPREKKGRCFSDVDGKRKHAQGNGASEQRIVFRAAFTTAQFSFRPEPEDVISGPEKGATAVPRFDQLWSPAQEAGRPAGSFIFSEKISLDTQAVGSNRVTGYHHDYGK